MHVYTNNKVTRIYDVIGTIRGALEPGMSLTEVMMHDIFLVSDMHKCIVGMDV